VSHTSPISSRHQAASAPFRHSHGRCVARRNLTRFELVVVAQAPTRQIPVARLKAHFDWGTQIGVECRSPGMARPGAAGQGKEHGAAATRRSPSLVEGHRNRGPPGREAHHGHPPHGQTAVAAPTQAQPGRREGEGGSKVHKREFPGNRRGSIVYKKPKPRGDRCNESESSNGHGKTADWRKGDDVSGTGRTMARTARSKARAAAAAACDDAGPHPIVADGGRLGQMARTEALGPRQQMKKAAGTKRRRRLARAELSSLLKGLQCLRNERSAAIGSA